MEQEYKNSTIEHSGYLIWRGFEKAWFEVSKLFTRREVIEMRFRIDTLDDFYNYENEFRRRSKIPNYAPYDVLINNEYEQGVFDK
jgi:hypothetical protein